MNSEYLRIFNMLRKIIFDDQSLIRSRVIFTAFLLIVTIALNITSPLLLKEVVSGMTGENSIEGSFLALGIAYGFCWGVSQITMQLREIISFKVIERIVRRFTRLIFDKINHLPIPFFTKNSLGYLLDSINRSQEAFPYLLSGLFFYMLPTLAEIVIACMVLTFMLPIEFTLLFLVMLLIYSGFSFWSLERSAPYQERAIDDSHEAYSYLVDRLSNAETIRIFCSQKYESQRLDTLLHKAENSQTKASVFVESVRLGQGGILGISLLLLTIAGILSYQGHYMKVEGFILVNAYFMQLTPPLNYFSMILKDIKSGLINLRHATEILELPPESHSEDCSLPISLEHVKFQNVCFHYPESHDVLEDISFELGKGKIISVVGKTGSGKSTLAKLILAFYAPSQGKVLLGDKDINSVPPNLLRKEIGYVPQDPSLFYDTLRHNLTYGNSNFTDAQLEKAIKDARLESFISQLPEGLNTMIGQKGVNLSGGEKQRIALARIFLTQKQLYIFDEATSALDQETQLAIQKKIYSLRENAAILYISHRLSSVVDSDEIIVMGNRRILERGKHTDLIHAGGDYTSLWESSSDASQNEEEREAS